MLSFNKGRQIAYIDNHGGENDEKIIKINEEAKEPEIKVSKSSLIDPKSFKIKGSSRTKMKSYDLLMKALDRDIEPLEDELVKLYHSVNDQTITKQGKVIKLKEGKIVPIFDNKTQRMVIYVTGPSGSGKSTFIGHWCASYKIYFPKNPIYLISRIEQPDQAFKGLKEKQIVVDDDFILDPIKPEELKNSMVIFDDCDTFPSKKYQDAVDKLKDDLLETGRKLNISVCVVSHLMTDYKRSKKILNECNALVCFPQGGSVQQIKYCLKTYFGFGTKEITEVIDQPSRWVMILKNYPQTVLYETGCYILSKTNV